MMSEYVSIPVEEFERLTNENKRMREILQKRHIEVRIPNERYQDICRHGLAFNVHCKECEIAGYCGCPQCIEEL